MQAYSSISYQAKTTEGLDLSNTHASLQVYLLAGVNTMPEIQKEKPKTFVVAILLTVIGSICSKYFWCSFWSI